MTDQSPVSVERLTDHELRELHARLGALPFTGMTSLSHQSRVAVGELLRLRSEREQKKCATCEGHGTVMRPLEGVIRPMSCTACNGTGKSSSPEVQGVRVPLTTSYAQEVPDKCDRIIWRNRYYMLEQNVSPDECYGCRNDDRRT